jgi:hypothetical protein
MYSWTYLHLKRKPSESLERLARSRLRSLSYQAILNVPSRGRKSVIFNQTGHVKKPVDCKNAGPCLPSISPLTPTRHLLLTIRQVLWDPKTSRMSVEVNDRDDTGGR